MCVCVCVCEREERGEGGVWDAHLLPAVDQALLHGRDPLLLLHALLYAGDLGLYISEEASRAFFLSRVRG